MDSTVENFVYKSPNDFICHDEAFVFNWNTRLSSKSPVEILGALFDLPFNVSPFCHQCFVNFQNVEIIFFFGNIHLEQTRQPDSCFILVK